MKNSLLVLILCFMFSYVKAQVSGIANIDSLAEVQAQQLIKSNRTNNVLIFQSGCVGCDSLSDVVNGCADNGTKTFLLWGEGEKVFSKEIGCHTQGKERLFDNIDLYTDFIKNKAQVFSSEFKQEYTEVHHDFKRLTLINTIEQQQIYLVDDYFSKDNKYRLYNLKQPAKLYIDKLDAELKKK